MNEWKRFEHALSSVVLCDQNKRYSKSAVLPWQSGVGGK